MTAKIIVLALCVAAVVGTGVPAARYPAGVNPHACPNYPYCDNALLAAHTTGHHGAAANHVAPPYAAYGHPGAAVHGVNYPAGVSPHLCPNYPYCGPTPVHHTVAHHGGLAAGHGEDDGSYRPWEYETPYQHQYDDGQYRHEEHHAAGTH